MVTDAAIWLGGGVQKDRRREVDCAKQRIQHGFLFFSDQMLLYSVVHTSPDVM